MVHFEWEARKLRTETTSISAFKLCDSATVDPETSLNMMNVRVQHGRVVVHAGGTG